MSIAPIITAKDSSFLSSYNTGLGNVLFQIASTYGLSKKTGKQLSFHNVVNYCNILKNRFNFNHFETILRKCMKVINMEKSIVIKEPDIIQKYAPEILTKINSITCPNTMINIIGYLESIHYFIDYIEDIRELFLPDQDSISIIKQKYPILFTDEETVSIHFRWHEYSYTFDINYYQEAILYIKNKCTKKPYFLLFSDDLEKIPLEQLGLLKENIIIVKNDYVDNVSKYVKLPLCY